MTTELVRPMFPHAWDSTMLSAFDSCPQKMFRTYVEHWKPQSESVHLVAGGAFAKGIEVARREFFENGRSAQDAEALGVGALIKAYGDFECPAESAKSLERTAGALEFYFSHYPLGRDRLLPLEFSDGRKAIEFSFAEPLEGLLHPVTGQPIIYTGRSDMLGKRGEGSYAVDEKTTSSLGASWGRQWEMRGQFTGYQWAANRAGIPVKGSLIRGISILKTKYDTQEVMTYRSEAEIARWLGTVYRTILRAIQCWQAGYWDYSLGGACSEYGGCSMLDICKSTNPESWLPVKFTKRVWDPLARREMTVEEWEKSWGHA